MMQPETNPMQAPLASAYAPEDDEISLLDLLQTIVENLRLLILGPLLVGLTALGISFAIAPTFTASTKFMPPQQQQSMAASMLAGLGALGGLAGAATGLKNPNDQYVAFLKSRSVQDALIDRFKLMEMYESEFRDDARLALAANVEVAAGKDGLITVEVSDKDPAFAAELANAHIEELQNLLKRLAVTEAQQRRVFFEKQLASAKDGLVKAEQTLQASGVSASILKSSPEAAIEGVAKLKAAITAQEIKLSSMRGYLAETAPDFKQALTELSALRAQLAKQERDEPAGTVSAGKGKDYIAAYRDYKYFETLFELFAKQFEMAKLDEAREGAVIQVLDPALVPERKSKPKKALIAVLATLASGFALLLFVFVRQALRNAGQSTETADKLKNLHQAWNKSLGRS
jgi:tyrosine-protein kinase Etk/Wzc